MLKWLITLIVAVVVLSIAMPQLMRKLKIGRLPGDVTIRLRGKEYHLPFASTIILSLLAAALIRLL